MTAAEYGALLTPEERRESVMAHYGDIIAGKEVPPELYARLEASIFDESEVVFDDATMSKEDFLREREGRTNSVKATLCSAPRPMRARARARSHRRRATSKRAASGSGDSDGEPPGRVLRVSLHADPVNVEAAIRVLVEGVADDVLSCHNLKSATPAVGAAGMARKE